MSAGWRDVYVSGHPDGLNRKAHLRPACPSAANARSMTRIVATVISRGDDLWEATLAEGRSAGYILPVCRACAAATPSPHTPTAGPVGAQAPTLTPGARP